MFITLSGELTDRCSDLSFLAPDKTPVNATAQATSATTIQVTWSPVSLQDEPFLQGYRIKYYRVDQPDLVSNFGAGKNDIQTLLTGLKPFTTYAVRVAAFATEDGNFTDPLYVKTWEWGKRERFQILLCMSVIYDYHISSRVGTICPQWDWRWIATTILRSLVVLNRNMGYSLPPLTSLLPKVAIVKI